MNKPNLENYPNGLQQLQTKLMIVNKLITMIQSGKMVYNDAKCNAFSDFILRVGVIFIFEKLEN